ncbi:hypothetical protein [Weeksella virosa]|uniref:Cytochrome c class I n=1 Tax=Weeksella virosa (strain ATCC 43766 / DSM 16922 / JCM 21250 / CCUG 30538 / CDC 9751 / IAM 14551 / NBRC 16016 / NCTC 11634 / CL345/78) TaxID=865938 RepID=F0P031_WEEVC|nr:hypothetical protein [Weeksella virosa]ADX67378.1 cytochrome c class I [Weeksella virosa DSM 16922]MDK7676300.1 hypothetical protein [Weeksella virosa]SUP53666.1 Uncharacterised protein [Weeksella virosa]VEH62884.1 Uncharacterised protein [Weeksella virosa]
MKRIILTSVFALMGTFAFANNSNKTISTEDLGNGYQVELIYDESLACCTATVIMGST